MRDFEAPRTGACIYRYVSIDVCPSSREKMVACCLYSGCVSNHAFRLLGKNLLRCFRSCYSIMMDRNCTFVPRYCVR